MKKSTRSSHFPINDSNAYDNSKQISLNPKITTKTQINCITMRVCVCDSRSKESIIVFKIIIRSNGSTPLAGILINSSRIGRYWNMLFSLLKLIKARQYCILFAIWACYLRLADSTSKGRIHDGTKPKERIRIDLKLFGLFFVN